MYSTVTIIHLMPALSPAEKTALADELKSAAAALPGTPSVMFEPTLPGVYNGGDFIWRSEFADKAAYEKAVAGDVWQKRILPVLNDQGRIAALDQVAYESGRRGGASPGQGIYRVALFCANKNPTPERLAQFGRETADMPRYIGAIRRWQLSTVDKAEGARPWTHVWEQEYDDLSGLTGPYMMHPCHWAQVDRWFDPEYPEWLVDTRLCHTFCEIRQPVIGG